MSRAPNRPLGYNGQMSAETGPDSVLSYRLLFLAIRVGRRQLHRRNSLFHALRKVRSSSCHTIYAIGTLLRLAITVKVSVYPLMIPLLTTRSTVLFMLSRFCTS